MNYEKWEELHYKKHQSILAKLNKFDDISIIEYFDYENMRIKESDFCPLYRDGIKCHDIKKLNCYLCGCPYFRYIKDGYKRDNKTIFSYCSINSKYAKEFESNREIHLDCSDCNIPHLKGFIKKYFDRDWSSIMSKVIQTTPK